MDISSRSAVVGTISGHCAFICRMMPGHVDDITHRIASLTARIEERIAPLRRDDGAAG